jgi:lipopolysaccharide export system permease protein
MLKNYQLKHQVDSLKNIFDERIKISSLGISYNSQLNENIQNHFRSDTLKVLKVSEEKVLNCNFDSIYSSLSKEKKIIVLYKAQQDAQMNQRNILQFDSDLYNRLKYINRHVIEYHRKYTLSLACIIFFFIGAPLGAIIRKGGFGMPIVVSILLFISYYLVSMIGENMAREGVWAAGSSMWFSTFIYFFIGIFITHQAITDSLLLNKEMYGRIFNKLNFLKFLFPEKPEVQSDEDTIPNE